MVWEKSHRVQSHLKHTTTAFEVAQGYRLTYTVTTNPSMRRGASPTSSRGSSCRSQYSAHALWCHRNLHERALVTARVPTFEFNIDMRKEISLVLLADGAIHFCAAVPTVHANSRSVRNTGPAFRASNHAHGRSSLCSSVPSSELKSQVFYSRIQLSHVLHFFVKPCDELFKPRPSDSSIYVTPQSVGRLHCIPLLGAVSGYVTLD